jgi:hypothetical protein
MQKQYEQVKLHVTLMNTRFRSEESEPDSSRRKQKPRESFDATSILKVCVFQASIAFMLAGSMLVVERQGIGVPHCRKFETAGVSTLVLLDL